jgi:hypothetical protein
MVIAGIFREANGANPPSFTMLTTEPGDDMKPFHNRQVVVVRPENWSAWLHLSKLEAELLRPLSAGSLAHGNGTAGVGLISLMTAEATRAFSDVHRRLSEIAGPHLDRVAMRLQVTKPTLRS